MAGVLQENYEMLILFGEDELRYSPLTKLLNVTAYSAPIYNSYPICNRFAPI